jgi:hypothetical protein
MNKILAIETGTHPDLQDNISIGNGNCQAKSMTHVSLFGTHWIRVEYNDGDVRLFNISEITSIKVTGFTTKKGNSDA